MPRLHQVLKNNAYVPYTIYLVSLMLFGMWSMAVHIHFLVPIALVGLAAVTQKTPLMFFNMAAAAVMAVYGLAAQFGLTWYAALGAAVAPLLALMLLTSALTWREK